MCDCNDNDGPCACSKCKGNNRLKPASCRFEDIYCYIKNGLLIQQSYPPDLVEFVDAMYQRYVPHDWQMCNWYRLDKLKDEHKNVIGVWYRVQIVILFEGKYKDEEYEIHIYRPTNEHKSDATDDELP